MAAAAAGAVIYGKMGKTLIFLLARCRPGMDEKRDGKRVGVCAGQGCSRDVPGDL